MNVSIVGTGYVGLVTGACLAEKGHRVICVDVDQEKISAINSGVSPIYEEGLEELLKRNVGENLIATDDLDAAVRDSSITLLAVGTPSDEKGIDLIQIRTVARQVGKAIKSKSDYHAVVVKSTVVPGTTDGVVGPILEKTSEKPVGDGFGLGMNPEFLTEGVAVHDFMSPDRIVLGGSDERTRDVLRDLYEPFGGVDKIAVNNKTAEMIKYASNALLATMISFSNEIGNLCATLGDIDVVDVMNGVHLAHYLSPEVNGERVFAPIIAFLEAGCGFGGSCLPKDVKALVAQGQAAGRPMELLDAVLEVNQRQHREMLARLEDHFPSLEDVGVSVLGLSFKPGTDDMRKSPAIPVVNYLLERGAKVKAYDPVAIESAKNVFDGHDIEYCQSLEEAVSSTDAALLVTRWEEFSELPSILSSLENQPLIVDGRRVLDKSKIDRYEGIGL